MSKKSSNPKCNLVSKDEQIKQVTKFKYLGYLITSDGRCASEISKRIAMAKDTFQKMKPILANRNMSMTTKIRLSTDDCIIISFGEREINQQNFSDLIRLPAISACCFGARQSLPNEKANPVLYRLSSETADLDSLRTVTKRLDCFPSSFWPSYVLIVTWTSVVDNNSLYKDSRVMTFQTVMATDGSHSIALFTHEAAPGPVSDSSALDGNTNMSYWVR
ncbi:craniofacial development protein 2 [Plakobranchus ocellatus]|uniref:Craniofacial development protein 2 n=1 Tax=Plakobranchus ocellatus TaxID=259542 RepID=A0AAV3YGP3_9GAST|nr:craniofacial development protein 2 [Plakobranchus ocellatus]